MLSGWQQALACGRIEGKRRMILRRSARSTITPAFGGSLASLKAYELPVLADALGMTGQTIYPPR